MKGLFGRVKAKRFSGPAVEQAFHLRHRRRVNCSEVRPLWEEVPNQASGVLIHAALPRMIGRSKEDVRLQAVRPLSVPGKLFAVVVGDRMDVVAQRCQPTHRGAVRCAAVAVERVSFEMVANKRLRSTWVSSAPTMVSPAQSPSWDVAATIAGRSAMSVR